MSIAYFTTLELYFTIVETLFNIGRSYFTLNDKNLQLYSCTDLKIAWTTALEL